MLGPPGTAKSMLARRLAGLLPPLSHDEALESAAILSVAGSFAVTRWGDRVLRAPGMTNCHLAGNELDRHCRLDTEASDFLQRTTTPLGWSAGSFHRILCVARTVADLDGNAAITLAHLGKAIQYRRALGAGWRSGRATKAARGRARPRQRCSRCARPSSSADRVRSGRH